MNVKRIFRKINVVDLYSHSSSRCCGEMKSHRLQSGSKVRTEENSTSRRGYRRFCFRSCHFCYNVDVVVVVVVNVVDVVSAALYRSRRRCHYHYHFLFFIFLFSFYVDFSTKTFSFNNLHVLSKMNSGVPSALTSINFPRL